MQGKTETNEGQWLLLTEEEWQKKENKDDEVIMLTENEDSGTGKETEENTWHAVYVLNKLPKRSTSSVTPHEAWFQRKPSLELLRVFGCTTWMKIPIVNSTKFDDKSKLVVHFDREPGTKAYSLFDPLTQSIHISRDVMFNEDKTRSWESISNTATSGADQVIFDFPETDSYDQVPDPMITSTPEVVVGSPQTPVQQTTKNPQTESTGSDVSRDIYDDSVTPR
ncbi:hypothetical protein AgCh_001262 [Apium graveolens]